MSNIYIKEPSTCGKVLLHTSFGDIDIELWAKEAPLACRNFIQLCMDEYYNNVIFHRVVPGFIVQGGDPTGTGEGGDSSFGEPFKDEFHQRLRFVRRGLVAMANAGPNDNGSQFFFTLGPCNDLNKKHTIFGKVTGDTVYNMIRLGEVDVGADERPLNPPCIKWTKVLANPFDDIEPRIDIQQKQKKKEENKKAKSQSRATKDYKLLSFGEEAEVDEEESTEFAFKGSKSSHDLAKDPRLVSTPAVPSINESNLTDNTSKRDHSTSSGSDEDEIKNKVNNSEKQQQVRDKLKAKKAKLDAVKPEQNACKEEKSIDKAEELRKESRKLARELLGKDKKIAKVDDHPSSESESESKDASSNPMFAEYKAQQKIYREKTSDTKAKGTNREDRTMAMLNSFRSKMQTMRHDAGFDDSDEEKQRAEEPAGEKSDDDDDDDNLTWMFHRFKNENTDLRDAKDMNRDVNEDRYDIYDPRNPINKRRREQDNKGKRDRERRHRDDRQRESSRSRHRHHRR